MAVAAPPPRPPRTATSATLAAYSQDELIELGLKRGHAKKLLITARISGEVMTAATPSTQPPLGDAGQPHGAGAAAAPASPISAAVAAATTAAAAARTTAPPLPAPPSPTADAATADAPTADAPTGRVTGTDVPYLRHCSLFIVHCSLFIVLGIWDFPAICRSVCDV